MKIIGMILVLAGTLFLGVVTIFPNKQTLEAQVKISKWGTFIALVGVWIYIWGGIELDEA